MNRQTLRMLALLAAVALVAVGCGGRSGGGGDEEEGDIVIGALADLTGATGDVGTPYNEGIRGYVDWRNAEGGIEGRQIRLLTDDYAYEVPRAEELYRRYVSEDAVAIQGWGTGDSEALRSRVASDELPFMSASYAEELADPEASPYNFVVAPTYSDQMRVALKWIQEQEGGNPTEVAVFHHDSPFGRAPLEDGQAYIQENGWDLGYQTYAMPSTPNFVGLLSQASSQGAKYIVIQNVSSPAAQVARDIADQSLDMRIVCLNWCSDELFVATAGAEAAEGHVMVQPWAPPSADKPGHEVVDSYLQEQGSSLEEKGLHYSQGWYTMHVMAEGIAKVLADGDDLTGANIRTALETMGPVDTGEVLGPVEFSADSHRGSQATGIYQVTGGELTEIEAGATP